MNEEKRQKVLKRIEHLEKEVEHGKQLINNPNLGRFWEGKVASIDGVDGEIRFLKSLLEEGMEMA